MNPEIRSASWSLPTRLAFRFGCAYWLIYNFPERLVPGCAALWNWLVAQTGAHLLHIQVERVTMTGSGDTTFDYVRALCYFVLAWAATAVWSVLDRRRQRYDRLADLLRSFLRFALAFWMIVYGVAKFPTQFSQFPPPGVERLLQPYGESSPMGLLWTFMGASKAYTLFAGLSEFLGGALLMFRRTAMLGALVTAGVMTHVVVQNFCYDVPVKLFSIHLLLMAVCVLLPERLRLLNVFLRNRSVEAVAPRLPYGVAWLNPVHLCAKWLLVALIVLVSMAGLVFRWAQARSKDTAKPPVWFGTYAVESFERDGVVVPPVLSDATRWHRLVISRYPDFSVRNGGAVFGWSDDLTFRSMTGATTNFSFVLHPDTHELQVKPKTGTNAPTVFKYHEAGTNLFALEAALPEGSVKAQLKRVERSQFLLANRGFHWINEYPFNR